MKKIIQNTSQKSSNSNFSHSQKHIISHKMKAPLNLFKAILFFVLFSGFLDASAQFTVAGPRSSCNLVNTYTITNFVVGSNYSVAINPAAAGVATAVNGNNQFQITWNGSPNATVTVTQTNPAASYAFDVYNCCRPALANVVYLNDMTASQITNGNGFTVTNSGGGTTVNYTQPGSQVLVINGVLDVDVTLFTFTNNPANAIQMGEGALIDFTTQNAFGPEILIGNSTLSAACNHFWKGIRLNNNAIKINNNSVIQDAEYAIENRNGDIKSDAVVTFLNNYIGIYAPPLNGFNTATFGTFNNTTFNCIPPLAAPYYNQATTIGARSYAGIVINNGPAFVTSAATLPPLVFNNLNKGIELIKTPATIVNCRFTNIRADIAYGAAVGNGAAIHARETNGATPRLLTVTIPNNGAVVAFNGCDKGIYTEGRVNLTATNTSFTNTFVTAILINATSNCNYNLNNNTFTNFYQGIKADNIRGGNTTINGNTFTANYFNLPNPVVPTSFSSTAISVTSTTGFVNQLNITNNIIARSRIGIYLSKFDGTNNQPNINGNTITNNLAAAGFSLQGIHHGIWLANVRGGMVSNNTITYTLALPTTASYATDFVGIDLDVTGTNTANNSPTIIRSNAITRTGKAVRLVGLCDGTLLQCNNFNNCTQGVFFDFASIGTQGSLLQPWDNQWTNFGTNFRVMGTKIGGFIQWYYRSPNSYQLTPLQMMPFGAVQPVLSSATTISFCSGIPIDTIIDDQIERIIADTTTYNYFEDQSRYMENKYAYALLDQDSLLRVTDQAYLNYYDSARQTNLGAFQMVDRLIADERFAEAQLQLQAINPENLIETYTQQVTQILLNRYFDEGYVLTEDDSANLLTIGYTRSWEGGTAVYTARVLLGLEVCDMNIGLRTSFNTTSGMAAQASLYPNPSNGEITIGNLSTADIDITVCSLEGTVLYHYTGKQRIFKLDFLTNGVYLLKIKDDKGLNTIQKFSIVK